jgi:hypothetical protein
MPTLLDLSPLKGIRMKIKLTKHCVERLNERTSVLPHELVYIYKSEKIVPLGLEGASNRRHDLFYSMLDDACFVAIRDVKTSEVVTILPTNYHNSWKISECAEYMAMELCYKTV